MTYIRSIREAPTPYAAPPEPARSPDQRWIYYYAHLQGYSPGLAEGQRVKRGQLIGRVGHTGNASPGGPHLHFAINRMQPGEKWYQGSPINPFPLLAGKKASG